MTSRLKKYLALAVVSVSCIIASSCSINVDSGLLAVSIKTISEYGMYFGAKASNLTDEKAKVIEESFRVAKQVLSNSSVGDFVDIDAVLANIPATAKVYIKEALTIVDSKYVELKGKIPADKLPLVKAIFDGGFSGIEKYRESIANEASVKSANYEVFLAKDYTEAKKVVK